MCITQKTALRVATVCCFLMEATYVASGDQEHVPWLVFFASIRYLAFAILSFESSRKKDIPYVPFIFKVMAVFWV